jgi:hypothetical protein
MGPEYRGILACFPSEVQVLGRLRVRSQTSEVVATVRVLQCGNAMVPSQRECYVEVGLVLTR